ncbi:MAG TPA: TonB-dependent receptor plug domain-containing protein [Methylocella sp.]|nr:TonB-dependent receptor plug domain-containing protein [Methylocella sp.]
MALVEHRRQLKRKDRLCATTLWAALALNVADFPPRALAQSADAGAPGGGGGNIALPTVEVTANQSGGVGTGQGGPPQSPAEQAGYSAPPVEQSTTKIDVPTFDLPISVQTVPEQVIVDQNATNVQDALENVSGVRSDNNNIGCYTIAFGASRRRIPSTTACCSGLRLRNATTPPICERWRY